jgi:hypothetical protein
MINLIPPDGVRMVRREYAARVLSVWAFILALAVGASALMLLPTYVLLQEELRITDTETAIAADAHAIATKELEEAQTIADRLQTARDPVAASAIFTHIEDALAPEIEFRSLFVTPAGSASQIQVIGTAMNREALQRFIGRLKGDPFFKDASVPVSDLARDVDLTFTLSLVLAEGAS